MFRKKILIIDDSVLMTKLIGDILNQADYDVVIASNGIEGIRKVREEKPDLVLLDIIMPEMNGFEVCKILREDDSNNLMPIIMLTARDNEEDRLEGLELGADDYIVKPFNNRELLSRVRNTLKRIDRNRWANPLTGLQGNLEIQAEINRRIALNEKFAVIYADLDNFKAYNDVYGYASGDRAIKLTADIIVDCVGQYGTKSDFVGHVGGDDFIIISTIENARPVCQAIIRSFDSNIRELYSPKDLERGFILTTSRNGEAIKYPIMSISMGVVTNELKELTTHLQVAEIAAELKKKAKAIAGSVYVIDKRKN